MTQPKIFTAAAILATLAAAPSLAQARITAIMFGFMRYPMRSATITITGPVSEPGTFAYYDGPSTNPCAQSAATYRGQDRRRYPCN